MRTPIALIFAALLAANGCTCGTPGSDDGGPGGGGGTGGSGGTGGGGGGGSAGGGGGSGGSGGGSGGTGGGGTINYGDGGRLELADVCAAAVQGFHEQTYLDTVRCGIPVARSEVDHLEYYASRAFDQKIPFSTVWSDGSCTDGGLAAQMQRYFLAVDAGRLAYDAVAAHDCQAQGQATRLLGGQSRDFRGLPVARCNDVWAGLVATGGSCDHHYECAGAPELSWCQPAALNTCGGTCQPHLAAGAICEPTRDGCGPKAPCVALDAGVYACFALRLGGEPCDVDHECAPNLICGGNGATPVCLPARGLGETCDRYFGGDTCGQGTCLTDAGNVLGAVGRCAALAQRGQACGNGTNGATACDSCFTCSGGVCVERGKEGATCAAATNCIDPDYYSCDAGTCVLRPRTGQPCGAATDGTRGNCLYVDDFCRKAAPGTVGVCAPLPGPGQTCGQRYDLFPDCPDQLYCHADAGVGVCGPYAGSNEACNSGGVVTFGLSPACLNTNEFCDPRPDAGAGVTGFCHQMAGLADSCNDVPCVAPYLCDPSITDGGARSCTPRFGNGSPCVVSDQCGSDFCSRDGGVCAAPLADGAACRGSRECESGNCNDAQVCTRPCDDTIGNSSGCMSYDLRSLSTYLFFSLIVVPAARRRRAEARRTRGSGSR